MATVTAENRDDWHAVIHSTDSQRPTLGRIVTITKGKHKNLSGCVTWHGPDAYVSHRYHTDAMRLLAQMIGREGYRIRVQPTTGAAFFTRAEYAEIVCTDCQ